MDWEINIELKLENDPIEPPPNKINRTLNQISEFQISHFTHTATQRSSSARLGLTRAAILPHSANRVDTSAQKAGYLSDRSHILPTLHPYLGSKSDRSVDCLPQYFPHCQRSHIACRS